VPTLFDISFSTALVALPFLTFFFLFSLASPAVRVAKSIFYILVHPIHLFAPSLSNPPFPLIRARFATDYDCALCNCHHPILGSPPCPPLSLPSRRPQLCHPR
jgi:hypothetical protein